MKIWVLLHFNSYFVNISGSPKLGCITYGFQDFSEKLFPFYGSSIINHPG